MIKKFLLALIVIALAITAYAALQPPTSVISRQATIAAPAAKIFPHVNSLQKWQAWSPWADLDPKATTQFEGPETGVGSKFAWSGNSEVGQGQMTIIESKPDELVTMKLDFTRPMAGTSNAQFVLKPDGGKTLVTWTMTGERSLGSRVACIIFYCERMIGNQFEKGLKRLTAVSERDAAAPAPSPAP